MVILILLTLLKRVTVCLLSNTKQCLTIQNIRFTISTLITISVISLDSIRPNVTGLLELTEKPSQTFQTTWHWLDLLQVLNGSFPLRHNNNIPPTTKCQFCQHFMSSFLPIIFAKKLQTPNVGNEKLAEFILYEQAAFKMLVNLTPRRQQQH